MSDMDDDDEGFEFEYSDEEDEVDDDEVDIENAYYSAKGLLSVDDAAALEGFEDVVSREESERGRGDWGFKSLKQVVKLHLRYGRHDEMLERYGAMLSYAREGHVTRNRAEKAINSVLDHVSASQHAKSSSLQVFYERTLGAFGPGDNERLWFKTSLKLGTLWFAVGTYAPLARLLRELLESCHSADGSDDPKKGTQLLEIYALDIQLCTATRDSKRLKGLYARCLAVKSAIPHPRIMGVIRECGGKMHIREREFNAAQTDFFEAFKSYDECGSPRRIQCLKYLVLANMLMQSTIDPFESQETKPYRDHPEIQAMTRLVSAYQVNNVQEFERIVRTNADAITADEFIHEHIRDLLRNVRTQVILKVLAPYTRVKLEFVASKLDLPDTAEVESIIISLILDGVLSAKIDQVTGTVEITRDTASSAKYAALNTWITRIEQLHNGTVASM